MEARPEIKALSHSGNDAREVILLALWSATIIYAGFAVERHQHIQLFSLWMLSFGCYWYLAVKSTLRLNTVLLSAIAVRFVLIFAFPKLSDDIYRFIWDGRLLVQGINPFEATPARLMESVKLTVVDQQLFNRLNSPEYFSVYPLVCQSVFYVSSYLAGDNIMLNTILIKAFLFFCECATMYFSVRLLKKLSIAPEKIFWYALNPLIVIEICGNAHFEGAMTAFLAAGIFYYLNVNKFLSALTFALSVASKMLTAIFFPLLFFGEIRRRKLKFILLLGIFTAMLSLPVIQNTSIFNSLDLYFRNFEFNAGIYYWLRWAGFKLRGYNQIRFIGPLLSAISFSIIILYSYKKSDNKELLYRMFWLIFIYIIFSTTVHPWYLSLMLFTGIFTRYRFPFVWSGLIFFTYFNYNADTFAENLWIVIAEYLIVMGMLLYETNIFHKIQNLWNSKK